MDAGQRDLGVSLSCGTKRQGCWNRVGSSGTFLDRLFSLLERGAGKGINDQKFFPTDPMMNTPFVCREATGAGIHGSNCCLPCGSFLFAPLFKAFLVLRSSWRR